MVQEETARKVERDPEWTEEHKSEIMCQNENKGQDTEEVEYEATLKYDRDEENVHPEEEVEQAKLDEELRLK